jgi:RsiW-degrading membrane proteinase PrsW (M82 family)
VGHLRLDVFDTRIGVVFLGRGVIVIEVWRTAFMSVEKLAFVEIVLQVIFWTRHFEYTLLRGYRGAL